MCVIAFRTQGSTPLMTPPPSALHHQPPPPVVIPQCMYVLARATLYTEVIEQHPSHTSLITQWWPLFHQHCVWSGRCERGVVQGLIHKVALASTLHCGIITTGEGAGGVERKGGGGHEWRRTLRPESSGTQVNNNSEFLFFPRPQKSPDGIRRCGSTLTMERTAE